MMRKELTDHRISCGVCLHPQVLQRVREHAARRGLSASRLIEGILREWLEAHPLVQEEVDWKPVRDEEERG